jgi:hypothetical protein
MQVVQGLINELESQGALPRSNSRVSSLATCCGQRCNFRIRFGEVITSMNVQMYICFWSVFC